MCDGVGGGAGAPLFEGGRNLKLTEEGRARHERTAALLVELDETAAMIASGAEKPLGRLRVSVLLLLSQATISKIAADSPTSVQPGPDRVPVGHLGSSEKKLIFDGGKPDWRLYEIATLAHLRDRLRSGDVWVDGSRSFRPIDEHLMPKPAFVAMKDEGKLGLGVHGDGAAWLAEVRQMMDFNLKRLAYCARNRKFDHVRLEAGTLIVTPRASDIPAAADELNVEISEMYPLIEVPDLLREVHDWTGFAD